MDKIKNSRRNLITGILKQVLNLLIPFVLRTVMIRYMGAQYQGLNGLFTSILSVLSLAELGFSSAVVFAMYRPISEGNDELLSALTNYLKRIYKIIGIVITIIGLCAIPFLRLLINGDVPSDINIYILYLIYLFNSVISYLFFGYKSSLISAYQREDINNIIAIIAINGIRIVQIVSIIVFKNYYVYIIILPLGSIASNLLLLYFSKKLFPTILPTGNLDLETHSLLNRQVKALFIGKISDVARNSFDSIIISALIGLTAVTCYENYYYIVSGIRGFFLIFCSSIQAVVGNNIASQSVEKNFKDFNTVSFIFWWINNLSTILLFVVFQPFMFIWMKGDEKLIFQFHNMMLMCLYSYTLNLNNAKNIYISGCGLFHECRHWYIIEAFANLLLNILLGYLFGMSGIIIASILTLFFFNFLARISILFNNYFKHGLKSVLLQSFLRLTITISLSILFYSACASMQIDGILGIVITFVGVFFGVNLLCVLFFCNTKIFKEAFAVFKRLLKINTVGKEVLK